MTDELITNIIVNIPNFAGFAILAAVMYRIVNRQLDMLQEAIDDMRTIVEKCCDDRTTSANDGSRVNSRQ